jgi:hypothetical protein
MYDRFDAVAASARLRLAADAVTEPRLADKLEQLMTICRPGANSNGFVNTSSGLQGDRISSLYRFYISRQTVADPIDNADFAVDFYDYPGAYLTETAQEDGGRLYKQLIDSLKISQVIVVAIDAPALMEPLIDPELTASTIHQQRNRPAEVASAIRDAYYSDEQPRLVILAPIRCEKYMQSPEMRRKLVDAVRDGYSQLLNFTGDSTRAARFRVVITPVETTGCVVFDHWEPNDQDPGGLEPVWRHNTSTPQYTPLYSEQPLCHVMQFALNLTRTQTLRGNPFALWMDLLANLMGIPGKYVEAIERVAKQCENSPDKGFAVIQPGP